MQKSSTNIRGIKIHGDKKTTRGLLVTIKARTQAKKKKKTFAWDKVRLGYGYGFYLN